MNGEDNNDGRQANYTDNYGIEGPTDDPAVNNFRDRQRRNMLATLFLSQGVPLLLAGDEMGRTQNGNNNAYCQDNEINWLDWSLKQEQAEFFEFVKSLIALRKAEPLLRLRKFVHVTNQGGIPRIQWTSPSGHEMTEAQWSESFARCVGLLLTNETGDCLFIIFNASREDMEFSFPHCMNVDQWTCELDTAVENSELPGLDNKVWVTESSVSVFKPLVKS